MTSEQEGRLEGLALDYLGPRADTFFELLQRLESAHPRNEEHYYLSLLGTHPDRRGQGIGMWLLKHDLEVIDTEHAPAYLESSNPANNLRYEGVGFEPIGEFSPPTMDPWSQRCGEQLANQRRGIPVQAWEPSYSETAASSCAIASLIVMPKSPERRRL